jgi:hypothetical protein
VVPSTGSAINASNSARIAAIRLQTATELMTRTLVRNTDTNRQNVITETKVAEVYSGLVAPAVEQFGRAEDPFDPDLDDDSPRVDPRSSVALCVAEFGVAHRLGSVLTTARPSSDNHRAPSTWLSTATPRCSALTAFCDPHW